MSNLLTGSTVRSDATGVEYEVGAMLGSGGFGTVYRAYRHRNLGDEVCLKVIETDQASWHREAYFGELLHGVRRAIQVHDSFVLVDEQPKAARRIRYCLALELAEHGSLADHLDDGGTPWSEEEAIIETVGLLSVLDHLHRGGALHRDLTPFNVFVCAGRQLKLGDFGIARHSRSAGGSLPADLFNSWFASQGLKREERKRWEAVDDTYQVAQLIGVLVTGKLDHRVDNKNLKQLGVSAHLQAVLANAIGQTNYRYGSAFEMLEGLKAKDKAVVPDEVRSLKGKVVLFTGRLSMVRGEATKHAKRVGATVVSSMSDSVDVVVQGEATRTFTTDSAGRKLLAAQRMRDKGKDVKVIDELAFRKLIG